MERNGPHLNGHHGNGRPLPNAFDHFHAASGSGPGWPDRFGDALAAWASAAGLPPVRTLSLFSGGGGLDLGFHQAGFDVRVAVEIDPACVRTLRANAGAGRAFPHLDVCEEDVGDFCPPPNAGFDLVLGCPPCQSFSAAGRRVEGVTGTSEDRGTLFRAYIALLKSVRPSAFVFENVAGLTGANGGRAWAEILAAFQKAGYRVAHRVLDAADFGVPQHRERLILVGVRKDLGVSFRFPSPTHGPDSGAGRPYYRADDAVRGVRVTANERGATVGGRYGHLLAGIPPGLNYTFYTAKLGHPAPVFAWRSKFSDFLYKADPAKPVRTLKAEEGGFTGPFHWNSRPFTTAEKKRLQTIPDGYEVFGNRGEVHAQIGNAVPCQLARVLALAVREQVFGGSLPFRLPTLAECDVLGFRTRKRVLTEHYAHRAAARHRRRAAHRPPAPAFSPREYLARWGEGFDFSEDRDAEGGVWVRVGGRAGCWQIGLSRDGRFDTAAFTVTLTPRDEARWPAGLNQIELVGSQLDFALFAAAWRALDVELLRNTGYADLVQVNGFYRTPQGVTCRLDFTPADPLDANWDALSKVVRREGVGETLTTRRLGPVWGKPVGQVRAFAQLLRTLGYEVRSRRTNAQIGPGRFLVPYPFPTLTRKSVQRHKSL